MNCSMPHRKLNCVFSKYQRSKLSGNEIIETSFKLFILVKKYTKIIPCGKIIILQQLCRGNLHNWHFLQELARKPLQIFAKPQNFR